MYANIHQLMKIPVEMGISTSVVGGSFDPDIFGPPFWFTLHNAAVAYYDYPNAAARAMMKQFIYSIPVIIPCVKCKEHAYAYIKSQNVDCAVENRRNLFEFFVTFHNYVNAKGGRQPMSMQTAEDLYGYYRRGRGGTVKIVYS